MPRDLLLFLINLEKHFRNLAYTKKKTSSNTVKIYRNIYRKKFMGDNLSITDIALRY